MRLSPLATLLAALTVSTAAGAQSAITLAPASGHPNLPVSVTGTGFGNGEAIDLYVDTVDSMLLISGSTGGFSGTVTIPASATPGAHYITAIGRRSGNAAQTAFTTTTPWTEYGYGAARQGQNPYENTLTPSTAPSLGVLWSSSGNTDGGTPAISGGYLYTGTTQGVQKRVAATGAVVWTKVTTDYFVGSPALSGNAVYIASFNGTLYALNAKTGATLWSMAQSSAFYGSPVVAGGTLYIGAYNGTLYALQASSGKPIWTFAANSPIDGSPAVANGIVYVGSIGGNIYALNATTGSLLWSYTTGDAVESTPALLNNVVYIGSDDDKVYALTAATGALRWSFTTGSAVFDSPAVANGTVYIGSADRNLYALDTRTGAVKWTLAANCGVGSPSVAAGVVYFTCDNDSFVVANAANGAVLTSGATGSSVYGAPAISDGAVYVNGILGLTAFSLQAGSNALRPRAHAPRPASLHPDLRLTVTR